MSTPGRSRSDGHARRWPVILAWLLALGAVAAFVVVLIGGGSTTTVIRTVIVRTGTGSASVTVDTLQGAVLAAEAVYSRDLKDRWSTTLGYRIVNFTPQQATVQTMERVLPRVKGRHVVWLVWNIHVVYQEGGWVKVGLDAPPGTLPFSTSPPAGLIGRFKPWPVA